MKNALKRVGNDGHWSTIPCPGYDLPRTVWSVSNRARTNLGGRKNLHGEPEMTKSVEQTIRRTVETCQENTGFENGIVRLHGAENKAATWITSLKMQLWMVPNITLSYPTIFLSITPWHHISITYSFILIVYQYTYWYLHYTAVYYFIITIVRQI